MEDAINDSKGCGGVMRTAPAGLAFRGKRAFEMGARLELAATADAPMVVIPRLGLGWVGEQALSISLYCALKFPGDFKGGTTAAVNHSGDSDSTGSITGAILGAKLGVEAIPEGWIARLENSSKISELAQLMFLSFGGKRSLALILDGIS
jgi:ADP-ribosylglycohydrolase